MNGADQRVPGEFELIARYFQWPLSDPAVLIGSGDDAALVMPSGALALATDTLVEGVHFLSSIDPARLAERALAVNLSDMAAMGAQPRWFTLALTLPHTDAGWLSSFSAGLRACAMRYDVALIGGDMTAGPLCISVHIAGEVARADALTRGGAQPGDAIFVTGHPGDAAAGLQIAQENSVPDSDTDTDARADARYLLDRYELPTPRVAAGIALRGVATAAIDISDGLAADLGRLCEASGCGARIEVERLPVSAPLLRFAGLQGARECALGGGDDYELCFAASRDAEAQLVSLFAPLGVAVTRIGECTAAAQLQCLLDGEPFVVPRRGYEHFS